jgi:alpha-ribazole phosphatase
MRIFLVRHGQTDANLEARYCGWTDTPLNADGRTQALALRPLVSRRTFEAVYASPLSRAVETAVLLLGEPDGAVATNLPVAERARRLGIHVDDALKEHCFGRFENFTRAEIAAADPEAFARWNRDFMGYRFPGGESALDLYDRVAAFGAELPKRHAGDVLVVSHMGPTVALMASMIGIPGRDMWRLRAGNASLCRIVVGDDGYAFLDMLNARTGRPAGRTDAWTARSGRTEEQGV